MTYEDFCRCTLGEFSEVCKAYNDMREANMQDAWNRMRMLACITIQPHVKKKLTPEVLIQFPWERKRHDEVPKLSKADAMKRFEKLMGKQKD